MVFFFLFFTLWDVCEGQLDLPPGTTINASGKVNAEANVQAVVGGGGGAGAGGGITKALEAVSGFDR